MVDNPLHIASTAAAHLVAIVESSEDAIVSKNVEGIVQFWNAGAERLYGYSAEEMVGQSIRRIIPPGLQGEEDEVLRRIRNGERVEHFETLRVRKDGVHLFVSLTVSPVKNEEGRVVGASKIARDVSARRLTELRLQGESRAFELLAGGATLQEALAALVEAVENQGDGLSASILLRDTDTNCLRLGAAPSLPKEYNALVEGFAIGPIAGSCGTAAYRGVPVIVTDIAKDELWAPFPKIRDVALKSNLRSCWSTPILSLQKQVLGTFAMYFPDARRPGDIQLQFAEQVGRTAATVIELKRADENRARLASIFESSEDAIMGMDLDGVVTGWSPSAVHLYGYSVDEMIGSSVQRIVPDEIWPDYLEKVNQIRARELVPAFDTVRARNDGRVIEVSIKLSPIVDESGHVIGFSAIHRDLSERTAFERLQSDFLAMVTHELRNPLTTIKGFAHILHRSKVYDDEAMEAIVDQAAVLERLIADLLDASRVQLGQLQLDCADMDLVATVDTCTNQMQLTTSTHDIVVESPGHSVWGEWDEIRLRQVLTNLLSNAIKYSDGTAIRVRIIERGADVQVDVVDQGKGIAPDELPHLFERFYRASPNSHSERSLGLGLYITRGIIEGHGGQIWASSEGEGKGSTFSFSLPPSRAG